MMTCEEKPVYMAPERGGFLLLLLLLLLFFCISKAVQLRWHSMGGVNLAVRSPPSTVEKVPWMGVTGVVIES